MFMLFWQMEMEGSGPEGNACGDRAEKGAQRVCYHPHLSGEAQPETSRVLTLPEDRAPKSVCAYNTLPFPPWEGSRQC